MKKGKRISELGYKQFDRNSIITVTLKVGDYFFFDRTLVRFIKVTPKGFNILIEKTGRCMFKRALPGVKMSNDHSLWEKNEFWVNIPVGSTIHRAVEIKEEPCIEQEPKQ